MTQDLLAALRSGSKRHRIGIIDGPGVRGAGRHEGLGPDEFIATLTRQVDAIAAGLGVELVRLLTNSEPEALDWLEEHTPDLDGLLLNPGGWIGSGHPLRYAIEFSKLPAIEVHMGNITANGASSIFSGVLGATVHGFHRNAYAAALVLLTGRLDDLAR